MIKVIAFDFVGVLAFEKDIKLTDEEEKLERMFGPNLNDADYLNNARKIVKLLDFKKEFPSWFLNLSKRQVDIVLETLEVVLKDDISIKLADLSDVIISVVSDDVKDLSSGGGV